MSITATKKKKDGLTQYRVRVSYKDPDGKFRVKERTAYGLQEAKKLEVELSALPAQKEMTFAELATLYVDSRKGQVKDNTAHGTQTLLHRVLPEFGALPLSALTPSRMLKWRNGLFDLKPSTAKAYLRQFSSVFNFAVRLDLMQKNPFRGVSSFRDDTPATERVRYYLPEQARAFLEALPRDSFLDRQYYMFFLLAIMTGARKGEILALRWSDLSGDTIHICRNYLSEMKKDGTPKTPSSVRNIRVPASVVSALADHRAFCSQMPGFSDQWRICGGVEPLIDDTLRYRKIKAQEKAGLATLSIHELRHTHASLLINAGVNIKEISRRLGHKSVEVTWDTYAHLYPSAEDVTLSVLESSHILG